MKLSTLGLHHLALFVKNLEACEEFYTKLVGMQVVWRPDEDNIYLSSGQDNLALHRAPAHFSPAPDQRLDHLGFRLKSAEDVDNWHQFLKDQGVLIRRTPKTHRDGAKSFYCDDPDGNTVQFIYHPAASSKV
ncbi:MAG: VOC family protein [Gammaproteobacteria bacterium]|nr:VOC family protein [Gammaproteobacteria bacterium]